MGHKLSEELIASTASGLRMHFEAEYADTPDMWVACAVLSNGSERTYKPTVAPHADPLCLKVAFDLLKGLNNNLDYDGAWICCLTSPANPEGSTGVITADYNKFIFLWMDRDGDIHVPVEIEDHIVNICRAGFDHWIEQCNDAHLLWQELQRNLDARPEHQFRRALGEKRPSLN